TEPVARDRMVCRAVQKVHSEIQASPLPSLPLIWSEFNASFANHPQVTDAPYMGPWLAETVRQCDGLAQDMFYWRWAASRSRPSTRLPCCTNSGRSGPPPMPRARC